MKYYAVPFTENNMFSCYVNDFKEIIYLPYDSQTKIEDLMINTLNHFSTKQIKRFDCKKNDDGKENFGILGFLIIPYEAKQLIDDFDQIYADDILGLQTQFVIRIRLLTLKAVGMISPHDVNILLTSNNPNARSIGQTMMNNPLVLE